MDLNSSELAAMAVGICSYGGAPLHVAGFSRRHSPAAAHAGVSFPQLALRPTYRTRKPLPVAALHDRPSSDVSMEDDSPSTSSKIIEDPRSRMKVRWGNIAWWIVVCYSVPFGFYTLPFIYGDFEIYKHFTVNALEGYHDLAGLHIANHLQTWQIHSAAALLFITIGPFQFNTSFRNKHPVIHKRLGYIFALCTVVTAVTGGTTMKDATELGPVAVGMSPFMSVGTLVAIAISIRAARRKNFQTHRKWMLRSAAIGYSVMYFRTLPAFIEILFGTSTQEALNYGFPLSVALNVGFAELYIQLYLSQLNKKADSTKKVS